MRAVYKIGARITALIHTTYIPLSLYLVLRPAGAGSAELINFSICTSGFVIGIYVRVCPLTFLERWLRKKYNVQWTFRGAWTAYYGILLMQKIIRLIKRIRNRHFYIASTST